MDFPRYVFFVPGPHQNVGFTYDHYLVQDQAEFDAAIKEGFSETVEEAKAASEAPEPRKASKGGK